MKIKTLSIIFLSFILLTACNTTKLNEDTTLEPSEITETVTEDIEGKTAYETVIPPLQKNDGQDAKRQELYDLYLQGELSVEEYKEKLQYLDSGAYLKEEVYHNN